jgi:RNA polymerase sigma factor (sigma-70 family)
LGRNRSVEPDAEPLAQTPDRATLRDAPGSPRIEVEDRGADHVDVWVALAELPRRQREVTVLRYFLQMSTQETAAALGVGEGTVKNSLSKARSALAQTLRIDDQEEHDVQT